MQETADEYAAPLRLDSEAIAAYRAIDRVLLWGYYSIPLSTRERPRTVYWDKFGRPAFEPKYAPAFPDGWWYEPKRASRIRLGDPAGAQSGLQSMVGGR